MNFDVLNKVYKAFYYQFDTLGNNVITKDELSEGINYLAKKSHIGRENILQTLKFMGIRVDTNLSLFKEGSGENIVDA